MLRWNLLEALNVSSSASFGIACFVVSKIAAEVSDKIPSTFAVVGLCLPNVWLSQVPLSHMILQESTKLKLHVSVA